MLRTTRPVVWVGFSGRTRQARYDDGANVSSSDGGHTWHSVVAPIDPATPCRADFVHEIVTTPNGNKWALCAGQPAVGNVGKAVYRLTTRGWKRVAYTPFGAQGGYGGISLFGYPVGMAMADDGFGLIWESRGPLYITRDGGSHWFGHPHVARAGEDFGDSGAVLPHGIGFLLLHRGEQQRLLVTKNRGGSWRVVYSWP